MPNTETCWIHGNAPIPCADCANSLQLIEIISEKGIEGLYGLVRAPGETEEQLRERLRIFLLERPKC